MSDATPLRVEEIGSLETTSVSTGSSFSADGVLIVVVPGHTYIPPSGLEDLCDQLQLLLPEDMVWVPNMRKMPDGVQAALKEDDLDFAALQLAQEVSAKVDVIEKEIGKSFALSFWCLGTGGLIARAALAWLTSRREKLLTFISFGYTSSRPLFARIVLVVLVASGPLEVMFFEPALAGTGHAHGGQTCPWISVTSSLSIWQLP